MEGFGADVAALRKTLAATERKLHQQKLADRVQVGGGGWWPLAGGRWEVHWNLGRKDLADREIYKFAMPDQWHAGLMCAWIHLDNHEASDIAKTERWQSLSRSLGFHSSC